MLMKRLASRRACPLVARLNAFQRLVSCPVLLYHSTYEHPPKEIRNELHNVKPSVLEQQLRWLKRNFNIVPVEHLFEPNGTIYGKAAVTFDDGYRSVFTEALPVLERLNVPATVFVLSGTLEGLPLWRDKVRFLINRFLVSDFLGFCSSVKGLEAVTEKNFFTMTKQPPVSSQLVDTWLDRYFEARRIEVGQLRYCVSGREELVDHPLISYGNHTHNHYVLSTLDDEQLHDEMLRCHEFLRTLKFKHSRVVRVFSVPFGQARDFDHRTVALLRQWGYQGFLYSRSRVNASLFAASGWRPALHRERYMPLDSFAGFQAQMLAMVLVQAREQVRQSVFGWCRGQGQAFLGRLWRGEHEKTRDGRR